MDSHTVEELLEHSGWLQGLARGLVHDSAAAEDLVQETLLAAVRRPPSGGTPRPWLGRVVRNLASNERRSRARRADHEERTHEPRTSPGPEELALAAESQKNVAEAVAALSEPYRDVVVLRYFRGLDSTETGRQLGIPPGTVRSRLARALVELRGALDRRYGDRRTWATLLLPLVHERSGVTASLSASRLPLALKLAVGSTAAIAIAWGLTQLSSPARATGSLATAGVVGTPEASLKAPEVATPPSRRSPTPAPTPEAAGARLQEEQVTLRGRFLYPDGNPVVGMEVAVQGWGASQARELQFGVPDDWVDPSMVTDEQGRFALTFVAPRAFQFTLEAKAPGHAEDAWRWGQLVPGTDRDLGDVILRPGGTVAGTLIRADGSPLVGESWRIFGLVDRVRGQTQIQTSAQVDPSSGTFRLEDLPAGKVRIEASSRLAGRIPGPEVTVFAGQVTSTTVTYDGPDLSRRLTLVCSNRITPTVSQLGPGAVRLVGRSDEPTHRELSDTYHFENLDPGSYSVAVDDPRFLPWQRDEVQPGTKLSVHLVGSSGLELDVRSSDDEPIELYSVRVTLLGLDRRPNTFELHDGTTPLADGRIVGLVPGSYGVTIDAGPHGRQSLEVAGVDPGEFRLVQVRMGNEDPGQLRGVLLRADGSPAPGARVSLLHRAAQEDSADSPILLKGASARPDVLYRKEARSLITAENGAFAFQLPAPGDYALYAEHSPAVNVSTPAFSVTAGEPLDPFELSLPPIAHVQGRIVAPPGAAFDSLRVQVVPVASSLENAFRKNYQRRDSMHELGADGSFRSQALPASPVEVHLLLARSEGIHGGVRIGGAYRIAEVELAPGVNELEFPLTDDYPGILEARVIANGQPLGGAAVYLEDRGFGARTGRDGSPARLRDFAGTHRLVVYGPGHAWRHQPPDAVTLAPNDTTSIEIHLELATATLTVLDEEGAPLGNAQVGLGLAGPGRPRPLGQARTTSPDGTLECTLPPGDYVVLLYPPPPPGTDPGSDGPRPKIPTLQDFPERAIAWTGADVEVRF